MTARGRIALGVLVGLVGLAPALRADEARFVNARLTSHSATTGLSGTFEALRTTMTTETAWIGYAVPGTSRGDGCCDRCLEGDGSGSRCSNTKEASPETSSKGAVRLEGSEETTVLFRVEAGIVRRIRTFQSRCALDAAGRRVEWLTDVKPAESTALLASFVSRGAGGELLESALAAIALHADTSATDALIGLARHDSSSHVRGQALFWLGQKASHRSADVLVRAAENDPESEVKEKAVFALSQLPRDEGVPLLLQQARTNKDPRVRQKAMFWLGQSGDPRALEFFEEVLAR